MTDVNDFLEHYGVKGMRWGVRRRSTGAKPSSDAKKVNKLKGRPASTLTNKQLRDINARLNLEQQYGRMNPSRVERGRNRAQTVLATAGIAVSAYNLINSPAGRAVTSLGRAVTSSAPAGARAPAEYTRLLSNR